MNLSNAVFLFKALGDITRLRIIKLLNVKECCVCELSGITGLSNSTISEHLKKLKQAGLVNESKKSYWSYYSLNKTGMEDGGNRILTITSLIKDDIFADDSEKLASGVFTCSNIPANCRDKQTK